MNKGRYIIRGLIDGSLSVTGVVIGAYNPDFTIIISAGLAGAVANGFSNMVAAFSAEGAVKYSQLQELEKSMLIDLKGTVQEKEIAGIVKKSAFYDGIATIVGGVLPIMPFFFLNDFKALVISVFITLTIFGFLGYYTAALSKSGVLFSVFKMVSLAVITAGISFLVRYIF